MSKLIKLKKWLTVEDAAKHFTHSLGERVTEADIYRLALDKHLVLSMDFVNHTYGRLGKYIDLDDPECEVFKELRNFGELPAEGADIPPQSFKGGIFEEFFFAQFDTKIQKIDGVWDLVMRGAERLDVEHKYQQLIDGPEVTLTALDGTFVSNGDVVCQLMESMEENPYQSGSLAYGKVQEKQIIELNMGKEAASKIRDTFKEDRKKYLENRAKRPREDDYYPAGGLPRDGVYVVKTDEIEKFLSKLDEETKQAEKPLTTRERNSLLILIGALCKEAKFDYDQRGISTSLAAATEAMGKPISDDTIRKILSQVKDLFS
ncbi:MAG: hypothetical protein U1F46_07340 [Marinagarivorans sp.]